jgi:hypothetical protein
VAKFSPQLRDSRRRAGNWWSVRTAASVVVRPAALLWSRETRWGSGAQGAVPRKAEVSVESCFLSHLLGAKGSQISNSKEQSHVRLTD